MSYQRIFLKKSLVHSVRKISTIFHLTVVSMGKGQSQRYETNLQIYSTKFQVPFLNATASYYQYECVNFIITHSIADYLIHVETCLNQESDRADFYLHWSSKKPILKCCENFLIKNHKEVLEAGFQGFIETGRWYDL